MKTFKNIEIAKEENPEMFHVISSNEVHSFKTIEEAEEDLRGAINFELKFQTGFKPSIEN